MQASLAAASGQQRVASGNLPGMDEQRALKLLSASHLFAAQHGGAPAQSAIRLTAAAKCAWLLACSRGRL